MLITYCGKRSGAAHVVICDIAAVTVMNMPGDVRVALCPNITGTIGITDAYFSSTTGACRQGEATTNWTGAKESVSHNYSVSLDSSRINSIYSGNKLQPKALQVLIIIKV